MRGLPKPIATLSLAMVVLFGFGGAANAQQSIDEIINALKPAGSSISEAPREIKMGSTRGSETPPAGHPASVSSTSNSQPSITTHGAPPAQSARPSISLMVNFPAGSAELTPAARTGLDDLAKALASGELAGFRFRIEGHTDNVGSRDENRALSQRRAEAVVSYLTSQYNVSPARLEAVGMGQESPLIETPPQTPEARNRRILVVNLGT